MARKGNRRLIFPTITGEIFGRVERNERSTVRYKYLLLLQEDDGKLYYSRIPVSRPVDNAGLPGMTQP
jgi:hypothetical protein